MAVLETLLAPALGLVNRQLRQSANALELTAALAGRTLAVRLNQSALAVGVAVDPDGLRLVSAADAEPDVIVEGSLIGLARLAGGDAETAIRDGDVQLSGDAELAEQFQTLLALARPDFGAELGRVIGDDAASGIGEAVSKARATAGERLREAGDRVGRRIAAAEDLPDTDELAAFAGEVRELRDRAARLEAAVDRLRQRRGQ
ncbi:MAG: SCP2 sterol-binding domain-containing protein [Pseudomonadota bacterium]